MPTLEFYRRKKKTEVTMGEMAGNVTVGDIIQEPRS